MHGMNHFRVQTLEFRQDIPYWLLVREYAALPVLLKHSLNEFCVVCNWAVVPLLEKELRWE